MKEFTLLMIGAITTVRASVTMPPMPTSRVRQGRSLRSRLLVVGGSIAGIIAMAGAGIGLLLWLTFNGILPMEDRETFQHITRIVDGYVSCFMVDDGEGGIFLVDTCNTESGDPVLRALSEIGRTPEDVTAILFTHGHADHTAGARLFERAIVHAHRSERPLLEGEVAARGPLPRLSGRGPRIEVERLLKDGEHMTIGQRSIRVFHLPGHTDGSVAYLIDETLLLGDNGHALEDGQIVAAPWIFSDDTARNHASLRALARRLKHERITPRQLVFSHSGPLQPGALERWATEDPG